LGVTVLAGFFKASESPWSLWKKAMDRTHEILTTAQMTEADRAAIAAGTPGLVLMQRAGAAVAEAVQARLGPRPVVVLCGPGNNGGDGYVAARVLAQSGWPVRTASMTGRSQLRGDAAEASRAWTGEDAPLSSGACDGAGLVIDALFGAGLSKPLDAAARAPLQAAERSGIPIVGVDLPSGMPGDAAEPLDYAPRCALTVTFHRKKIAHVLEPARSLCGEVMVADIGLADPVGDDLFENDPSVWEHAFPWPGLEAHKHSRGSLVVVSGPMSRTGAARLAARGGLRIGAGLVTVLSPPDALMVNAAHLEAVMLAAFANEGELANAAARASAAVIGPAAGVGPATRANLLALAGGPAALVVDADALTTFQDEPQALFAALGPKDVMTPHPGEFERLFPGLMKASSHRIAAAREASRRSAAVVLLKGPDTVVAAPDGRAAVNVETSPFLATAGSGDVLAGFIGGLLAQGMPSFEAACAGAWIHAQAGRRFGPGLIAEDLPDLAPAILAQLNLPGASARNC
jgi:hydroxyethylthiazole kinase-like uncharacterized protein yjeF